MATKFVDAKTLQRNAKDCIVTEDGDRIRCTSLNAVNQGIHDYIVSRFPHELPLGRNGEPFVPGDDIGEYFIELATAIGGREIIVRTGQFTPGTAEHPAPIFDLQHPKESSSIAVHVLWDATAGYPLYDKGGLNGQFGRRYQATWHHRYLSTRRPKKRQGEDVWILPAHGPAKFIADYAAVITDRRIVEGDLAAKLRTQAEQRYQAEKATYRSRLEESGLIERLQAAYANQDPAQGVTLRLDEDELVVEGSFGTDRYRYDALLLPKLRANVELAEGLNHLFGGDAELEGALQHIIAHLGT